jgi:hypothetical protein
MEHDAEPIQREEQSTEAGGERKCESRDEDRHRGADEKQQRPKQFVTFIDMTQTWNDAEQNGHGIARLPFRRLGRAARPVTTVASLRVFGQEMPAVGAGHLIGLVKTGLGLWGVGVFHGREQRHKPRRIRQAKLQRQKFEL